MPIYKWGITYKGLVFLDPKADTDTAGKAELKKEFMKRIAKDG